MCNRRCEDACTRGTVDQAVAIDEVKKFIAQQDLNAAHAVCARRWSQPSNRRAASRQKIAVIGAGPAGLSCAYYLAERGYKPTVFEKNERPGGMLVYGIPSFKLEKRTSLTPRSTFCGSWALTSAAVSRCGKDVTLADAAPTGLPGVLYRHRLPGRAPGRCARRGRRGH